MAVAQTGGVSAVSLLAITSTGGPALLLVTAVFDLWCVWTSRGTPGQLVQTWARDHPFLAAMLGGFVGAFGAHIFWHS